MKKIILTPLAFALLLFYCASCAPDFDFDGIALGGFGYDYGYSTGFSGYYLPGTPATFIIHEPDSTTTELYGDAYWYATGSLNGPGSAIHKNIASYDSLTYFYELECIPATGGGIQLYFDFHTTSLGQPLDSITTGTYYAHQATYRHADVRYEGFHYTDSLLNQQLGAVVYVTEKKEGRITGSFIGKYYQRDTGEIVTVTGEFKNVYVFDF